jgi:hypothetical protein
MHKLGPHYHDHEDEWFYIVEGRDSFFTVTGLICFRVIAFTPRGSVLLLKIIQISLSKRPLRFGKLRCH